jgi:hypothetical protein
MISRLIILTKENKMKKTILILAQLLIVSIIYPQSNLGVKMEIGNGTSSMSDFTIEIEERGFSASVHVDRLKSTVKNIKFKFEDDYYNEMIQTLGSIASASASGIQIKVQDGREGFLLDIGNISYSLNDWEVDISQNGPKNMPVFTWEFDLQKAVATPSSEMTRNLKDEEWRVFNYFAEGRGSVTVKKISGNMSLDSYGKISAKGIVILPVGKGTIEMSATINRDLESEPFINSLKFNMTNLSPEVKSFLNDLILNENVPLRKKGNGFLLEMSGSINNPRFR